MRYVWIAPSEEVVLMALKAGLLSIRVSAPASASASP